MFVDPRVYSAGLHFEELVSGLVQWSRLVVTPSWLSARIGRARQQNGKISSPACIVLAGR